MPDFTLPDLGEGVTEAEVDRWLVAEGDEIAEDDPLVEVITDKATAEIPSPFGGVVQKIHVSPGQVVPVGTTLVTIGEEAAPVTAPTETTSDPAAQETPSPDVVAAVPPPEAPPPEVAAGTNPPEGTERDPEEPVFSEAALDVKATPPVRKLARELGVELAAVKGTGPGGRILREDVEQQAALAARLRAGMGRAERAATPGGGPGVPAPAPEAPPEPTTAPAPAASVPAPVPPPQPSETTAADPVVAAEATIAPATAGRAEGVATDEGPPPGPAEAPAVADVDAPPPPPPASVAAVAEPEGETSEPVAGTRAPLRGIRRTIAERMAQAHRVIPPVTHVEECDVTDIDLARRAANERSGDGIKLTFLPFIVKAVAGGLRGFPALNASLDEEAGEIVYHDRYDIGIAVDTPAGLVVPVVKDAGTRTLNDLAGEIDRLAGAARAGTLTLEELQGATFTITSPGPYGGLMATPIISHPQVAILGVHRAVERAVVREGQIVPRLMMNLSITFDHRVLDGMTAARFLLGVVRNLEQPEPI